MASQYQRAIPQAALMMSSTSNIHQIQQTTTRLQKFQEWCNAVRDLNLPTINEEKLLQALNTCRARSMKDGHVVHWPDMQWVNLAKDLLASLEGIREAIQGGQGGGGQ